MPEKKSLFDRKKEKKPIDNEDKKTYSDQQDIFASLSPEEQELLKPLKTGEVLVDDLIATGGTIEAAAKLVEQLGGTVVKIIFLMELAGLKGRERLAKYDVASVVTYEGK